MFCSVLINVCVVTVQKMVMTTTTASTGVSDKDLQIELSTIFALRHMQDRLPPVVSLLPKHDTEQINSIIFY